MTYFNRDEDCTRNGFESSSPPQSNEEKQSIPTENLYDSSFSNASFSLPSLVQKNQSMWVDNDKKSRPTLQLLPPKQRMTATTTAMMDVDEESRNATTTTTISSSSASASTTASLSLASPNTPSATSSNRGRRGRVTKYTLLPFEKRGHNGELGIIAPIDGRSFILMMSMQKTKILRDMINGIPKEKNNDLLTMSVKKTTIASQGEIVFRFVQPGMYSIEHTVEFTRHAFRSCAVPASFCIRISSTRLTTLLNTENHKNEEIVVLFIEDSIPLDAQGSLKSNTIQTIYCNPIVDKSNQESEDGMNCNLQLVENAEQMIEESTLDGGNELLVAANVLDSLMYGETTQQTQKEINFAFSFLAMDMISTFLQTCCGTYSNTSSKTTQMNKFELTFQQDKNSTVTDLTCRKIICSVAVWNGMQSRSRFLRDEGKIPACVQTSGSFDFEIIKLLLDANLFYTIIAKRKTIFTGQNAGGSGNNHLQDPYDGKIVFAMEKPIDEDYVDDKVIIKYSHPIGGRTEIVLRPLLKVQDSNSSSSASE